MVSYETGGKRTVHAARFRSMYAAEKCLNRQMSTPMSPKQYLDEVERGLGRTLTDPEQRRLAHMLIAKIPIKTAISLVKEPSR